MKCGMAPLVAVASGWMLAFAVNAGDLFVDGKLREIPVKTKWTLQDTQGGYGMYPGEGKWEFFAGATVGTTGPDNVILGRTTWDQWDGSTLFASMALTVNLNQGGTTSGWSGSPCSGTHLVTVNKPRGTEDHCMTLDTQILKVGSKDVTFLKIRITHSAGGGRYYQMDFSLNPYLLGHMDTVPVDWTPGQMESRPDRKAFVERMGKWGETLLDASYNAFGYSKPQDAFKGIASYRTLMPVSDALAQKKYPLLLMSAWQDFEYRKGSKAFALSMREDGRNRWGRQWGAETQAEADRKALEFCEKDKADSLPPCTLFSIP